MSLRNPVITGMGIVSALGGSVDEVWDAIRAGRSGLGPLTLFSSARYATHLVGQVRQDLAGAVRGSRSDKLAWMAASQALENAGFEAPPKGACAARVGVVLGSTVGGMLGTEEFLTRRLRAERHRCGELRFHECAGAADLCARRMGASGPCVTVSTACSAGAMAIASAAELIETGQADVVLAGGSDSLCRLTLNGFGSLLLLDPKGCRPFDQGRTGISLGEGAAMLVLEAEDMARARGVRILARLSGWGASCDAWHATAPHPEGRGALAAMRAALDRAGLQPGQVDFVSAHGTGTPDNDATEARALRQLFPARLPPVASVMRFFGHTLAASGPIKAVLCVRALREQAVPPNPGFERLDPRVGFEPVRDYQPIPLSHILSNSFGFGGNNVALLFSTAQTAARSTAPTNAPISAHGPGERSTRLAVIGAGAVSAAGRSVSEAYAALRQGGARTLEMTVPPAQPPARLGVYACTDAASETTDAGQRRRLSRLQEMALDATRQCLPGAVLDSTPRERICVALGTGLGSLNDTAAFLENMILRDERAPRPLLFTNSVHNSLASQVAIQWNCRGLNSTPVQREVCFEAALWQAASQLSTHHADLALVGAADELNPYFLAAGLRWGWWDAQPGTIQPADPGVAGRKRALPGEGCTMFTIARADSLGDLPPLAWVSGARLGRVAAASIEEADPVAEARWIEESIVREGGTLAELDLLLTSANGWKPLDDLYRAILDELSRLAGRPIPGGAYKHGCGEHPAASAFGFLAAVGLVLGDLPPSGCAMATAPSAPWPARCRLVALHTLSPSGVKALCCVRA